MSEYGFYETPISNVKITDIQPECSFEFKAKDDEVLRLDKDGFHYKGQTIDDAGEAYRLFMHWMKKANGGSDDI